MWDRGVTDLSFHTLIKSHPGVLDASQSPGALGEKNKKLTGGNIIPNAEPLPFCLCPFSGVVLYIHRHKYTSKCTQTYS